MRQSAPLQLSPERSALLDKPLSTRAKLGFVASGIGVVAGVTLLGATHFFGTRGSRGFIASLAAGTALTVSGLGTGAGIAIARHHAPKPYPQVGREAFI